MIKIFIADDHSIICESLATLLNRNDEFDVVGQANDGRHAIDQICRLQPDVAIIDYGMPELNGVQVMQACLNVELKTRFIILTMHEEPMIALEAIQAGALGFITKGENSENLKVAVHTVMKDKIYISQDFHFRYSQYSASQLLSGREKEVLKALAHGLTTKETGSILKLSPRTVETYRNRIRHKSGLNNISELTKLAVTLGLT